MLAPVPYIGSPYWDEINKWLVARECFCSSGEGAANCPSHDIPDAEKAD